MFVIPRSDYSDHLAAPKAWKLHPANSCHGYRRGGHVERGSKAPHVDTFQWNPGKLAVAGAVAYGMAESARPEKSHETHKSVEIPNYGRKKTSVIVKKIKKIN